MFTIIENYKALMKMCVSASFEWAPSAERVDANMDNYVDNTDLGQLSPEERAIVKRIITDVYGTADNIADKVESWETMISLDSIRNLLGSRQNVTSAVHTGWTQVYGEVVQAQPAAAYNAPQSYVTEVAEAMQGQPLPIDGRYVHGVLYNLWNGQTGTYDETTCSFNIGEANYNGYESTHNPQSTVEYGGACPIGTPDCNPKYGYEVVEPTTTYAVTPSVDQPKARYVIPDCPGGACDLNRDGLDDRVQFKDSLDTTGFYIGNHPEVQWYGSSTSGRGQELIRSGYQGYDYVITTMELPGCWSVQVVIEPKPEYKNGLSWGNGPHNNSAYSELKIDHAETIDSSICNEVVKFPTLKKGAPIDPSSMGGRQDENRTVEVNPGGNRNRDTQWSDTIGSETAVWGPGTAQSI